MKVWKDAIKLRDELASLSLKARDAGEHNLQDALNRAWSELMHPAFTQEEDKGK